MKAIETVCGSVTAPSTTITALTALTGDSFRVRDSKKAWLLDIPTLAQGAGVLRVTSPLLHDAQVGITLNNPGGVGQCMRLRIQDELTPQDLLSVAMSGSATMGDVEQGALTILYEDLAGINANLITHDELMKMAVDTYSFRVSVTTSATSGYSADTLLTGTDNQLYANELYAILGVDYQTQFTVNGVMGCTFSSPDWGNLRYMCPQFHSAAQFKVYFADIARATGLPLIPVFNASQRDQVFARLVSNEVLANTAVPLTVLTARLGRARKAR